MDLLGRYLADEDLKIRVKALNLVGNMVKHSSYFLNEFIKQNIISGIVGTLKGSGSSH